jgi:hypothetical protein
LAGGARWVGVITLRGYGACQNAVAMAQRAASKSASILVRRFDRPYAPARFPYAPLVMIAIVALAVLFFREM